MLNQVIIVGRVVNITSTNSLLDESALEIILEVTPPGLSDVDYIPVSFNSEIALQIKDVVKPQGIIGVKGRLRSVGDRLYIIGEKVTFISTHSKEMNYNGSDC